MRLLPFPPAPAARKSHPERCFLCVAALTLSCSAWFGLLKPFFKIIGKLTQNATTRLKLLPVLHEPKIRHACSWISTKSNLRFHAERSGSSPTSTLPSFADLICSCWWQWICLSAVNQVSPPHTKLSSSPNKEFRPRSTIPPFDPSPTVRIWRVDAKILVKTKPRSIVVLTIQSAHFQSCFPPSLTWSSRALVSAQLFFQKFKNSSFTSEWFRIGSFTLPSWFSDSRVWSSCRWAR